MMWMSMRLLIYKKMVVTLVIAIFALVQSVECDSESARVSAEIDDTALSVNVTVADSWKTIGSGESKQMSDFFARDDVEKFLISLRTFLMGVRNFAEALGGFVPNDQPHNEKNAMISRYSGIFSTVRVLSNAVQYITKFLEDLVIRELEDNRENKALSRKIEFSSMMQPFSGAFKVIRSLAASAITTYNYYSPEIAYSRCVGQFVQNEYPGILPEVTLPSTFRALRATYQFAANYVSMFMTQIQHVRDSVQTSFSDTDENNIENEIDQNIEAPLMNPVDYRQQLSALYHSNSDQRGGINHGQEGKMGRRIGAAARSVNEFSYGGPRQLDNVDLPTGLDESNTTPNSIFNFDNTIAEHLGMQENPPPHGPVNNEIPSFGKCTQNYAIDVLWRLMERLIMNENVKS